MMENLSLDKIKQIQYSITGCILRTLVVKNTDIYLLYIPQITNRTSLSENIIKPLLQYSGDSPMTPDLIGSSIIYIDDIFYDDVEHKIVDYILQGNSVIILSTATKYIVSNLFKPEKRSIEAPEVQSSIRSPRDAFNESLNSNLSLIRYRIKDTSLKVAKLTVGTRTKTAVAMIYLEDVANPKYVVQIKKRLEEIKVDGVLESGYIQKFISNKATSFFPQIGIVERSDLACANVLDGKICILVDGSNLGLIAPKNLIEFFDSSDDHYDNTYISIFLKYLRVTALLISLTLSSLYVAIVAFHSDILPSEYILALAVSRVGVPVNAVMEATIMEFIIELLREANLRLPKQIGPSIAIVGTIVIGQALVSAGLVSSPMIIIVSLTSVASFAVLDFTIMNPIRLLKFFMIFLTGTFGLFGFSMGLSIILIKITSITSFGVPYTAPVAPFYFEDIKNFIFSNVLLSKERPNFLKPKNKRRR